MTARAWWAGALLVSLVGCSVQYGDDGYGCANPDTSHLGPDGRPDPCHRRDADAGGPTQCAVGEFAHWRHGWEEPSWIWIGAEDNAPDCPYGPASIAYEGHADLVAPAICEACTCQLPTGSCALPSAITARTNVCSTPGGISTSFNAPASWNGQCDSANQVPSGDAYSLTIDALAMAENGCNPGPTIPAKVVSLHWNTFARGCDVKLPDGPIDGSRCLPIDPLAPGFKACIFREGENECPTDEPGNVFTEQHIFYQGVQDSRQCSACTCGPPSGSACTAMISIFKGSDVTCSGPALAQNTISSAGPVCIDIALPGQALGSKAAGPTNYIPGTCPAMGGDASGAAIEITPATFCCRP